MFLWFDEEPAPRRKRLTKDQRQAVWDKYIGRNRATGKCYVCDAKIHVSDFDVGHNVAKANGGTDNLSNFRPLCRQCNRSMGTMSIEKYKAKLNGPATTTKKTTKKQPTKRAPARRRQQIEDPFAWFQ